MGKNDYCIVPGCGHMPRKGATCKFLLFPTVKRDRQSRERWIKAIGKPDIVLDPVSGESIPWEPKPNTKICTCHWDTPPDTRSRRLFTKTVTPHIFPDPNAVKQTKDALQRKPEQKPQHAQESPDEELHHDQDDQYEDDQSDQEPDMSDDHHGDSDDMPDATDESQDRHEDADDKQQCGNKKPVTMVTKTFQKTASKRPKRTAYVKVCLFCFKTTTKPGQIETVKVSGIPVRSLIQMYGGLSIQTGAICRNCMKKLGTLHRKHTAFVKQCDRIKSQLVGGKQFVSFKCRRASPTKNNVEFIPVKSTRFPERPPTAEEEAARALTSIANQTKARASAHSGLKVKRRKTEDHSDSDSSRTDSETETTGDHTGNTNDPVGQS